MFLPISCEQKQIIANQRASELKERIQDYLDVKGNIKTGFDIQKEIQENRQKILEYYEADSKQWNSWIWQINHRINNAETLSKLFPLNQTQISQIQSVEKHYRWAISPYYASLILKANLNDPIYLQAIPCIEEMEEGGDSDPMGEEFTSPAPLITRRYPDRLIINVTNMCAMYCRHCQRKRNIGEKDSHNPIDKIQEALDYIKQHSEIRDVLVTGGDALLLSDDTIDWLLNELNNIDHVEIKRLGTRSLVTLPQRITPKLCAILEKYPPIYINTQFNHPQEITPEAKKACDLLTKAGVILGNQSVLLKNINNHPHIMKKLNHELLKIRVRPYYIFHAKQVKGTRHFITSIEEGINIMENLRGYTSGLAIPTYIINAPKGYGKTPILPQYLQETGDDYIKFRTWENREIYYAKQ